MGARTLYDKLWDSHLVRQREDGTALLYVDRHLIHEGFTLPSGNFPATFFVVTSFHGMHVFTGVCYLLITAFGVWRGKHLENGAHFVVITGLFWHFVDLIWILVFTFVYLL